MNHHRSNKLLPKLSDRHSHLLVGLVLFLALAGEMALLNVLLRADYRACELIPDLCATTSEAPRGNPLKEIDNLRPGAANFKLGS